MTNASPDPQSRRKPPVDFDELIAIIVAFGVLGAILAWGLTRSSDFNWLSLGEGAVSTESPSPSAELAPAPEAGAEADDSSAALPAEGEAIEANPSPASRLQRSADPKTPGVTTEQPVQRSQGHPELTALLVPLLRGERSPQSAPAPSPAQPSPETSAVAPAPVPAPASPSPAASPSPSIATAPATIGSNNFSDVSRTYWAVPFIAALEQRDIVSGFPDGSFRPNQPVTRAEFAAQLQKAFARDRQATPINYGDVPQDFWGVSAIDSATRMGFMKGYPGNVFRPESPVSRAEVLVALMTGLGLPLPQTAGDTLEIYQDAASIPNYATLKVAGATQSDLVVSYPNPSLLNPREPATRADVAAMIYQGLVATRQAEELPSQYRVERSPSAASPSPSPAATTSPSPSPAATTSPSPSPR